MSKYTVVCCISNNRVVAVGSTNGVSQGVEADVSITNAVVSYADIRQTVSCLVIQSVYSALIDP